MAKLAKRLTVKGAKAMPKSAQNITSPMNEDKWRAQDDARTLAQAAEISADPKRMRKAKAAGKELTKEHETKAHNLKAVFGRGQ